MGSRSEIIPNEDDWTADFGSEVVVSGRFMMIGDRYARDEGTDLRDAF